MYVKAENILPEELIELIQQYIDGRCLYIPRKDNHKRSWGESNGSKEAFERRNREIYEKYKSGFSIRKLADLYYLSEKTIQKIIGKEKKSH